MHIRRLEESDAEAYRALRLRALREHPDAFGRSYEEDVNLPLEAFAQRIRRDPDAPDDFVLGAFVDGLVGMAGFRRERGIKEAHRAYIWGVYVVPEMRAQGIARALLEMTLASANLISGLEQIHLSVVTTNLHARSLYHALGFETYGVEPRTLKVGSQYFDEELMLLRLV